MVSIFLNKRHEDALKQAIKNGDIRTAADDLSGKSSNSVDDVVDI